jgi:hypothetical protein
MYKMNVFKTVIEVIDGVEKEFVMIELYEYSYYMHLTNPLYEKIAAKEKKAIEKEQKQEDIERRRIEKFEERNRREKEEEINYQNLVVVVVEVVFVVAVVVVVDCL